jgi:hypothetical protein
MAENVEKRVTVRVGATYTGSAAMKSAVADVEKLRKQAELPVMGPLTREQSAVEAGLKQRITAMERAGERLRVKERVDAILFGKGGGGAGAIDKQTEALKRMGVEIVNNSRHTMTWEKAWKAWGAAIMATKAADVVIRGGTLAGEWSRANARKDLAGMTAADEGIRDTLTGIPLAGRLGEAMQTAPFFSDKIRTIRGGISGAAGAMGLNSVRDYFDDGGLTAAQAKEDAERATREAKALDERTAKLKAEADQLRALRDTAIEYGKALSLAGRTSNTSEGFARVMTAAQGLQDLAPGLDKQRLQGHALQGEQADVMATMGLNLMRDFRRAVFADLGRDAGRANDRMRDFAGIDARIADRRLRDDGRNFEADIAGVRYDAAQQAIGVTDPAMLAKIREEQAAKESSIARKYHRELLDERRDFQRKMEQTDATAAERRLRLSGKAYEADKLQLANSFQAQAAEIKDRYEAMIRANPSEAPTLRRRAAQETKAAGEGYALGIAELMRERGGRFLPGLTGGPSGETKLSTGAIGRGESEAARQRDILQQQLKTNQNIEAAVKNFPATIAKALQDAFKQLGFGTEGTPGYQ